MYTYAQSTYQVASMQSDQVKLVENDFVYENDHLKVIYNLWEEGGRMRFMLYNKTDQPIYIDWSKSFIERNGFVTVYSRLAETARNSSADVGQYIYQKAEVQPLRRTARTNPIAKVPPHTYVAIADFLINHVQEQTYPLGEVYTYTKGNSPLQVEHRLAYSSDKSLADTLIISNSFWAESIHTLGRDELSRLYGSLQFGKPNALYALHRQPYEPISNYERSRGDRVTSRILLGILSVVVYIIINVRR
ncbi:hypothetical protein GCM10027085_13360 [Spirosoma aerophilum]